MQPSQPLAPQAPHLPPLGRRISPPARLPVRGRRLHGRKALLLAALLQVPPQRLQPRRLFRGVGPHVVQAALRLWHEHPHRLGVQAVLAAVKQAAAQRVALAVGTRA